MVGGGEGALIGAVHRIAARLDGQIELVDGCLSSTPEKAARSAHALGLERSYSDYAVMAKAEANLADGIDAVAIVTPNHMHTNVARAFLDAGIHVICDKPLSTTLADGIKFAESLGDDDPLFFLTHNYTGTPMIREARAMIARGEIGDLRLVQVEYVQDWLSEPPAADNKQAEWRTDPARSGAGAIGDIGTHGFNLASFVTGKTPSQLAADLTSFVAGRQVDDNAHILMRYENGARGTIWASQVAVGHENSLRIRVSGTKGGLDWAQEDPNRLWFTPLGEQKRMITRGGPGSSAGVRVPAGHPEGYLEAFGTLYAEIANAIRAKNDGVPFSSNSLVPTIKDGISGMQFIDACQRSSSKNTAWVKI
jgi:predicted dehydrogenase